MSTVAGSGHSGGALHTPLLYLNGDSSLSSGSIIITNTEHIGDSGPTTLTQSGGTHTLTSAGTALAIGSPSGSSGTYNLLAGNLSATNANNGPIAELIGGDGTGVLAQSGGTHTASSLVVGYGMGSGLFNLSGGSVSVSGNEDAGKSGNGTINQTGGTNTITNSLYVGTDPAGNGQFTLSGATSSLTVGQSELVGYFGIGVFNQTGGTNTATTGYNALVLGNVGGSSGTYNLSGGTLTTRSSDVSYFTEMVGSGGTGTFNQTGGTHNAARLLVGWAATGSYNLTGGTLNVTENSGGYYDLMVGSAGGAGHFYQNGGVNNVLTRGWALVVGWQSAAAHGDYTLVSGDLNASEENIGMDGVGTFTQSGGHNTITPVGFTAGQLFVGRNSGSNGTYSLSNTANLTLDAEAVGVSGTGTFNQNGGTHTVVHSFSTGLNSGATGTYNLNSGTLTIADEYVGYTGTGVFNQTGGTNNITGGGAYGGLFRLGRDSGSHGSYTLSDGVLNVTAPNGEQVGTSGTGTFTQTGGTHTVAGAVTIAANPGSTGSFSLGGGTLTAGAIHVNAGGTFGLAGNAPATVLSTSVLTNSGTLSVSGNSATTTNLPVHATIFTQAAAGTLHVVVGGTGDGQYGQLRVGQASFSGALTVTLAPGYTPHLGDSFTILRGSTLMGFFSQTNFPAPQPCAGWAVSYTPTSAVVRVVRSCPADFNCDGVASVQDIFDFLTAWFASDPRGDFNGDGQINVGDIFSFLGAWFTGC